MLNVPRTDAASEHVTGPVPLQALIVDYGGVLTGSLAEAMGQWCAADGVDPERFAEVMRQWLTPGGARNPVHDLETGAMSGPDFERALVAELVGRGQPALEPRGLLGRMFAAFEHEPDMFAALARARGLGWKTAMLSNSWDNDYPRAALDGVFDVEVISGEVGLRKPDSAIFALTAERLCLPPAACVFVDDLRPNVRAAVEVGMVGVHHTSVRGTLAELEVLFTPA